MRKKLNYDFSCLEGIFQRPEHLDSFAQERMEKARNLLKDKERYNCPPACKQCCYGSILMSYTEYNYIMLYLEKNWSREKIAELFRQRVGLLRGDDADLLLCPFLEEKARKEHCSIYPARPLICRVFGTTAAPCGEPINATVLEESLFYLAYDLLYYANNNFIALNLDNDWAVYEAPFALWCLADNSRKTRKYLRALIEERKDSFAAVLYDKIEGNFFVLRKGAKSILAK